MTKPSAYILPHEPNVATIPAVPNVDTGKLWSITPSKELKVGSTRIFYNTPADKVTAVVSLGERFTSKDLYEKRELVRKAVGSAVKQVKDLDLIDQAHIDAAADPHAAGKFFANRAHLYMTHPKYSGRCSLVKVQVLIENITPVSFQPQS